MDSGDTADIQDTVAITLRIDRELHRRIRVEAAHEEKSMTQWIREALKLVADRTEAQRA